MGDALKSTFITNRDATPAVLNTGSLTGNALLREVIGSVTTTTAGTSGSTYALVEIPSNARVGSLVFHAAAMTVGKFNIGVYKNTAAGGGVAFTGAATFFGAAVDCASAVADTNLVNNSVNTITKQEQPLWQAVGMSTDPRSTLDIIAVATTAITLGGLLGVRSTYVV